MKKILCFILTVALLCPLTACGNKTETSQKGNDTASTTETSKKDFEGTRYILCWGDSITQGMGMTDDNTYPARLQANLDNVSEGYKVINAGVPGEDTTAIMSRAGVLDIVLTKSVTFKAGEASVALDRTLFSTANGEVITYKGFGNQLPFEKVEIDGEEYTINFQSGETYDDGIYNLTREETEKPLTLKKGASVSFDYSDLFDEIYCNVILMGANDTGIKSDALIAKYKKIAEKAENNIFIIPFYSEDFSEEFEKAFGDNAINFRLYMQTDVKEDYNITFSDGDENCIKQNDIPRQFVYEKKTGDCHLNEISYPILADRIYIKGQELGFWK